MANIVGIVVDGIVVVVIKHVHPDSTQCRQNVLLHGSGTGIEGG